MAIRQFQQNRFRGLVILQVVYQLLMLLAALAKRFLYGSHALCRNDFLKTASPGQIIIHIIQKPGKETCLLQRFSGDGAVLTAFGIL